MQVQLIGQIRFSTRNTANIEILRILRNLMVLLEHDFTIASNTCFIFSSSLNSITRRNDACRSFHEESPRTITIKLQKLQNYQRTSNQNRSISLTFYLYSILSPKYPKKHEPPITMQNSMHPLSFQNNWVMPVSLHLSQPPSSLQRASP